MGNEAIAASTFQSIYDIKDKKLHLGWPIGPQPWEPFPLSCSDPRTIHRPEAWPVLGQTSHRLAESRSDLLKALRPWLSDGFDQAVMLGLAEQVLVLSPPVYQKKSPLSSDKGWICHT
jgi:hypothetical protein